MKEKIEIIYRFCSCRKNTMLTTMDLAFVSATMIMMVAGMYLLFDKASVMSIHIDVLITDLRKKTAQLKEKEAQLNKKDKLIEVQETAMDELKKYIDHYPNMPSMRRIAKNWKQDENSLKVTQENDKSESFHPRMSGCLM